MFAVIRVQRRNQASWNEELTAPEVSDGHYAFLRFINLEIPIGARLLDLVFQLLVAIHAFQFPLAENSGHRGSVAFAAHGQVGSLHLVSKAEDFFPEVSVGFFHKTSRAAVYSGERGRSPPLFPSSISAEIPRK